MKIIKQSAPNIVIRFDTLKIGDIFKAYAYGELHYYIKISTTEEVFNGFSLTSDRLSAFEQDCDVIKVPNYYLVVEE